jgi:hypothetical protein
MNNFAAPFLSFYVSPSMNSQIFNVLSFVIDRQDMAV